MQILLPKPRNPLLQGYETLAKHLLSWHPQRVCLVAYKVREREEKREKVKAKNRGPYLLPSNNSKLRSTVYYNDLYSLTIKVNYQTNLTKTITMRVERRKTKNGAV